MQEEVVVVESMRNVEDIINDLRRYSKFKSYGKKEVGNVIMYGIVAQKFSLRNSNFMTISYSLASDGLKTVAIFSITEREEGLINFSLGKKQKMRQEISQIIIG